MEKMKMETPNLADENFRKLSELFPNAITETITGYDDDGSAIIERAIDADVLRQEISSEVVEGKEERYQFTWPDKKKAIMLANEPTTLTLRLDEENSVGRDGTPGKIDSENIYIEGDNLDALKILRETYLGKVKMIYIDPPYNTGNDFLYNDRFTQYSEIYAENSGQLDEYGNIIVQNTENNGRFHTNWLNMMFSRLRVARSLLTDDGSVFISIDDHEVENLKKICDEIFGESNFVAIINWKGRGGRQDSKYFAAVHEYILCYAKNKTYFTAGEEIKTGDVFPKYDENKKRYYKTQLLRKWGSNSRREDRPNLYYPIQAPDGTEVYPIVVVKDDQRPSNLTKFEGRWRHGASTMKKNIEAGNIEFIKQNDGSWIPYEKIYAPLEGEEKTKKYTTWIEDVNDGSNVLKSVMDDSVFDYPKTPSLIERFLKMANVENGDIVLDFFSGSATTAHAVLKSNSGGEEAIKYILVQIKEKCKENSNAFRAGFESICDVGEERIRRAGKKIKEETGADIDYGFRVFKVDSSNMEDVYYTPSKVQQQTLDAMENNIKSDRTPMDLIIQVMLDLGVKLSGSIEEDDVAGKRILKVDGKFLVACFDDDVTDDVVTEIAKMKPVYAVFRDSSMADDSVATNFDQIFETYSPNTERRVL